MGKPTAARWARIWCWRPVTSVQRTRARSAVRRGLVGESLAEDAGEGVEVELGRGVHREAGWLVDDVEPRIRDQHAEVARAGRLGLRGAAHDVVVAGGDDGRGLGGCAVGATQ